MGGNAPDLWAYQPDRVVSHTRQQLRYITDTCTMMVTIPEDKRQALINELVNNCGPTSRRQSFKLMEAAKLLGVLVSLCHVCSWGIFLFQNLYHATAQILRSNSCRANVELTRVHSINPRMGQVQLTSYQLIQISVFCKKVAKVIMIHVQQQTTHVKFVRKLH
jgi:hypothetical protein